MKKQWIALLTGCVLVCSMLAGCGSKPQTSAPAAAGSDKGCTDEAILSQLKNDGTPEFVLDGTYYTLPLETSQLIQAGWSLETEEYDAAEVSLQPGERIYGELSKDDQEIDVAIVNAGTEPCKPAEGGTVVELEYSADKDQPNPDFFVTLNGINCAMSNAALQKALEGVDGYKLNSAGNIDINRTVDDDEIAVYKVILDDDYTAITLASDNVFEYKDYQPQEVKEQASNEKIAAYKDTTKAEMLRISMRSSRDMKKIWSLDFTVKVLFGAKKSVNINLLPERRSLRMCLSTSQRIQPASSTVLLTRF